MKKILLISDGHPERAIELAKLLIKKLGSTFRPSASTLLSELNEILAEYGIKIATPNHNRIASSLPLYDLIIVDTIQIAKSIQHILQRHKDRIIIRIFFSRNKDLAAEYVSSENFVFERHSGFQKSEDFLAACLQKLGINI